MARPDDRYSDDYDREREGRPRRDDDDFDYEGRNRFRRQDVPNYLVPAILVTLFCCQVGGIIAIVYAVQANSKAEAGDYEGALKAADTAKIWMWVTFVLGLVITPLMIYLQIAAEQGGF